MKTSKTFTVELAILMALLLLTAAIAVPIYCRPFYYAHIGPLGLVERTGLTEDEIRTAYDEMLDYSTDLGDTVEFSTGVLAWSENGKGHFTDVRGLFHLDLWVLCTCVGILLGQSALTLGGRLPRPAPILGRGPAFWAGAGLGGAFLLVGALASLNFDVAFVVFHALFFPGKTNWLFDPETDQIINILPQEFFRNCAILILAILVLGCTALILSDLLHKRQAQASMKKSQAKNRKTS